MAKLTSLDLGAVIQRYDCEEWCDIAESIGPLEHAIISFCLTVPIRHKHIRLLQWREIDNNRCLNRPGVSWHIPEHIWQRIQRTKTSDTYVFATYSGAQLPTYAMPFLMHVMRQHEDGPIPKLTPYNTYHTAQCHLAYRALRGQEVSHEDFL